MGQSLLSSFSLVLGKVLCGTQCTFYSNMMSTDKAPLKSSIVPICPRNTFPFFSKKNVTLTLECTVLQQNNGKQMDQSLSYLL